MTSSTKEFAFHDISLEDLPLKMEFFRTDNNEKVHEIIVEEAPIVVEIPALRKREGCLIWTRLTWGDGEVTERWPEDANPQSS